MVGYWDYNGEVNDQSGNGNNGAINGTVPYVAGKFSEAASFNGTYTNYVSVPNSPTLSANWSSFVISYWIKTSSQTGTPVSRLQSNGSDYGFAMQGGNASDNWYVGSSGSAWKSVAGGNYYNSTWNNMALLFNGSSLTSYLNGNQVATTSMSSFRQHDHRPGHVDGRRICALSLTRTLASTTL